jgi:hypothetical protein
VNTIEKQFLNSDWQNLKQSNQSILCNGDKGVRDRGTVFMSCVLSLSALCIVQFVFHRIN